MKLTSVRPVIVSLLQVCNKMLFSSASSDITNYSATLNRNLMCAVQETMSVFDSKIV